MRSHLERDGFDEQLDTLAADIANLATNRLVFLRSAVEGKIAFDVRSLQEFMAAGRLTASPEASIRDRLYEIAGRAHWQLVFRIACSKIYASTGHEALHDALIGLLDSLDAGDRSSDGNLLLTGSKLAVDLLLDGTVTSVPNYRRKLLSRAMNLVSSPESRPIARLKGALDLSQRSLLEPLFVKALNDASAIRQCMFRLLAQLSFDQGGAGWVTELLLAWWPGNEEVFDVFNESHFVPVDGPVAERLRAAQWQTPPGGEAYVASQRAEGWLLVPDHYNDGGISGATLERPALQRLLSDIEADRVDVVVVYKIDRLSRSLTLVTQYRDQAHGGWPDPSSLPPPAARDR